MAIEKVIIQNFKKFKNPFEVKFNENINLLVGDNESGKSTILEAIHVALTGMYAGRNIRNQLSTYLFNREAVEEYLASVKNEQPIAPPEIMIELYFKSGTLSHKQAEKASIVLIEEPESHLSFSRLSELMGVIEKAASGRQIIASTHSSFVANKLGLENLILLSGDNCCSMQSLKTETFEFFKKVAGYDTLRLILCKKSILVEGDSDELVVQRAYMDTHEGRLPIQDGIDVMTVGGVTFKRYLEIAQTLNKETAVVTDNDGNIEAVKKKYKEYEEIQCIHICVDEVVDTGDLKLSDKDFNYNTLEPKILKENGREAMNNIFGTNYDTDDEMHKYMHAHKTDCAIAIFESATKIKYPEYIMRAIKNE